MIAASGNSDGQTELHNPQLMQASGGSAGSAAAPLVARSYVEMGISPTGQASTQAPHRMQVVGSRVDALSNDQSADVSPSTTASGASIVMPFIQSPVIN